MTGKPNDGATERADRRTWATLITIIAVCFLTGIAFLVVAVWLDWE